MTTDPVVNVRWQAKMDGVWPSESENYTVFTTGTNQVGGVYKLVDGEKNMLKAHGYNHFCKETRPVPAGATFEELNDYQRDHFCRDAHPEPQLNGLKLQAWQEHIREQCLTILDLLQLKHGQQLKVLVIDRNLCDVVCNDNHGNTLYDPELFFRYNTATYTHNEGLQGNIIYHWRDQDSQDYRFEFEIEYEKDRWYPLEDGQLPKTDPQGFSSFSYQNPKLWSSFPQTTRIGWRGPMLLWEKVRDQPKVYWYER